VSCISGSLVEKSRAASEWEHDRDHHMRHRDHDVRQRPHDRDHERHRDRDQGRPIGTVYLIRSNASTRTIPKSLTPICSGGPIAFGEAARRRAYQQAIKPRPTGVDCAPIERTAPTLLADRGCGDC
jgi:hypothetical protein